MGRLYDAYVEVGPRFAGFGDIKKQGDAAGREYGKALAEAAAKAAAANVRRLGEALAKARSGEADAAGKVRVAEQKLAEVRAQSGAKASSLAAAEEALASAQRKATAATDTTKAATEALGKARDKASSTAETAGKVSGNRFTNAFRGALSKVDKDGAQVATRFGVGFNGVFGGIASRSAGLFAAGFALVQGAKVFTGFINDAEESAKVSRITANAIKATGGAAKITADQVGTLATAISNKTGIDDEQVQTASNMLLTFKNIRNEAGKNNDIFNQATQAAADLSVQFGGIDGASKQLGKALNDPVKGITALNKAGVTFSDTQKKQIKSFVESGNILGAQKILLKEVSSQVGGAAAAAGNPLDRLKVIAGNLSESFGGLLLPVVHKFANFISDTAVPGIYALGSAFQGEGVTSDGFVGVMERIGVVARSAFGVFKTEVLPRLKDFGGFLIGTVVPAVVKLATNLATTFAPTVKDVFGFFKTEVIPRLKDFAGFLGESVLPKVGQLATSLSKNKDFLVPFAATILAVIGGLKAWAIVQAILNAELFANPIGLVVLAIAGLVGGLVYAYKHSETFRDIVNKVFAGVKDTAVDAFNVIKGAIHVGIVAFDAVKDAISATIGFVSDHWKLIVGIIGGPFIAIVLLVTTYWGQIKAAFSTAVSAVLSALSTAWSAVVGVVSGPMNLLIGVVQAVWSRIMPILVLPFYIARTVIAGVWTGIEAGFTAAVGFVQGAFAAAWNVVQAVVIAPLDKAWHAIVYVWALIQAGFTVAKDWVITSFSKAWSAVAGVLTGPVTTAKTWIGNRISDITGAFTSAKNWVLDTFAKAWDGVRDKLTKPISDAKGAIATALGAGKNGLQWVFSQAVSAVGKIWDGLQELAKAPIRFIVNTVLNDGLIGGFNWIADKFKAPTIPTIPLPKGFEAGGRIPGAPSMRDNLVARGPGGEPIGLATGEFITNAKDTARALPVLEHINRGGAIAGFADGGLFGKLKDGITGAFNAGKQLGGDVLGFLKDPVAWFKDRLAGPLQKMDQLGDSPAVNIIKTVPKNLIDSVVGKAKDLLGFGGSNPGLAGALGWARSQAGKPYVWGGVGPDGYDCSGFMSAIVNFIQGRPLFQRRFATGSLPAGLFEPGPGAMSIGWRTGNPGHTAGTLNGTHVESRGGEGALVGSRARGADDSLFTSGVWHLKGFANGGRVGDLPFDLLSKRGKHFDGDLAASLGVKTFDTGLRAGKWAPGTLAYNGTGKGETVRTAEQEADLKRPLILNARIFIGTREITDIVRVEIDEKNRQAANSFNL